MYFIIIQLKLHLLKIKLVVSALEEIIYVDKDIQNKYYIQ